MDYKLLFLINILFIFGLHVCFKSGMIFEQVADWVEARLYDILSKRWMKIHLDPEKEYTDEEVEEITNARWEKVYFILKPFYYCAICMSSVWGSTVFLLFSGLSIFLLPVWVFCLAGANYIVNQIIRNE